MRNASRDLVHCRCFLTLVVTSRHVLISMFNLCLPEEWVGKAKVCPFRHSPKPARKNVQIDRKHSKTTKQMG